MKYFLMALGLLALVSCIDDSYTIEAASTVPSSFSQVAWVNSYGGSGNDTPRAVIKTTDGGFAVFGYTNSTDGDLEYKTQAVNDYWVLKFNADGDLQWQQTYGGSGDDKGQQIIQLSDGGYAVTGYAESEDGDASNNEGFHDNWILRLDAGGTLLWEKSFGFSGHDHSYDLVETQDGGLFFSGFLDVTSSNGEGATAKGTNVAAHGVGEFWGSKVDGNGSLQWRNYFGGTNNDRAYGVVLGHDGGYVMAGASESDDFDISNPKGSYDFWVVKVDDKGKMVWENSYGGTGIDQAQALLATTDSSYVIAGNTFSSDTDVSGHRGQSDIWLIKIDGNGQLLWQQTYGGSGFDAAHSVQPTQDGGFLLCGNSKSADGDLTENFGENDIWIIKVDANGGLQWQKSFGGLGLDFGYDALQVADGSYILVGETASADFPETTLKGGTDLILIKLE